MELYPKLPVNNLNKRSEVILKESIHNKEIYFVKKLKALLMSNLAQAVFLLAKPSSRNHIIRSRAVSTAWRLSWPLRFFYGTKL